MSKIGFGIYTPMFFNDFMGILSSILQSNFNSKKSEVFKTYLMIIDQELFYFSIFIRIEITCL
jgi:hypothetical protein